MKLTDAAALRIAETDPARRFRNRGSAGRNQERRPVPGNPIPWNTPTRSVRPTKSSEDKGVKILVDPKAVLFLLGTEMDYKADKMQSQFIFKYPNQTGACGCGDSVQLTAAKI